MKRRIFAWVLLAGFVVLLLNLIVFRFYWQLSMVVYLFIVFAFMLTNGKLVSTQDPEESSSPDEPDDSDDSKDRNRIGRYLDDAVVLNKEAVDEDYTEDDTINSEEDKTITEVDDGNEGETDTKEDKEDK